MFNLFYLKKLIKNLHAVNDKLVTLSFIINSFLLSHTQTRNRKERGGAWVKFINAIGGDINE